MKTWMEAAAFLPRINLGRENKVSSMLGAQGFAKNERERFEVLPRCAHGYGGLQRTEFIELDV